MLIEIFEPDLKYVAEFSQWLIDHFEGEIISERVLDVADTFRPDCFHGVRAFDPNAKPLAQMQVEAAQWLNNYTGTFPIYVSMKTQVQNGRTLSPKQVETVQRAIERDKPAAGWLEQHADVVEWLKNYKGDFPFYVSLQHQFRQRASLSPKQVESVRKAIARDQGRALPPTIDPAAQQWPSPPNNSGSPQTLNKSFTLLPGEVLRLSRFIAKKIGEHAGLKRAFHVVEVVSVEQETPRAYLVTLKLSGQRTSHCGICGLKLTDPQSVAVGVGPYCAEKVGISYGEKSLEELQALLSKTILVKTWLPKSTIKERFEGGKK